MRVRPASDAIPVELPAAFPRTLLSLSNSELEIVMVFAHPLAPAARSAFFAAVAARLAGAGELGDGLIARCCRELQRLYFDPPATTGHEPRWARDRARKAVDAQARWAAAAKEEI